MVNKLLWDTRFFDRNVYKISNIKNSNQFRYDMELINKDDESKLIYLFINSNELNDLLERQILNNNFLHVDTKVTFEKTSNFFKIGHPESVREITVNEFNIHKDEIYELSYLSGRYSRFRIDSNITKGQFESFYQKWVENAFNKTFGNHFLITSIDSQISGFLTMTSNKNEYSQIGLISIKEIFQGRGIGRDMLIASENIAFKNKCKSIYVATQKTNIDAVKFYNRNNYNLIKEELIFHLWVNK